MSRSFTIYFSSDESMKKLLNQVLDSIGFAGKRNFNYQSDDNYLGFYNEQKHYYIDIRKPTYPPIKANRDINLGGGDYDEMERYLHIVSEMLLTTMSPEMAIFVDDFIILHRQGNRIRLSNLFWATDFLQQTDFDLEDMK